MQVKFYCYVPEEKSEEVIECGLRLGDCVTRNVSINGTDTLCFEAYLHPNDAENVSTGNVLIKISAPDGHSYIADNSLLMDSTEDLYEKSVMPARDYRLGRYRKPCCLISCTVLPDMIERYNPDMDEPLLYQSSEQLYRDSLFYRTDDLAASFKDVALNAYYNMKAAAGEYAVQFNDEYAAFSDRSTGEIIAIVKIKFSQEKG